MCIRDRAQAPDSLVIFISNKEELVFQTFEVQPFRFIRKSEYQKLLPALVDAISQKLEEQTKHLIFITEPGSGDIFSFDIRNIFYVEAQRKNCLIVTTEMCIRDSICTSLRLLLIIFHISYYFFCF